MPKITKNDVVKEALGKTDAEIKKNKKKTRKVFDSIAAIISISVIVLSIIMYSYYNGYCKVFNIPTKIIPINIKDCLPFAINIVGVLIYVLYYIAYIKTDRIVGKNKVNVFRIFYGYIILCTLLFDNNIDNLIGKIWSMVIPLLIPIAIEVFVYFAKRPKKPKDNNVDDPNSLLEEYVFNIFMYNSYIKYGMFIFILLVLLAGPFGGLSAKAEDRYQICTFDNISYAVIVDYDDKVLVEEVKEIKNKLIINTKTYRYIDKESIEFEYKEFDKVTIDK